MIVNCIYDITVMRGNIIVKAILASKALLCYLHLRQMIHLKKAILCETCITWVGLETEFFKQGSLQTHTAKRI